MRSRVPGSALVGGVIVAVVLALALVSLFWTPFDPLRVDPGMRLQGPSGLHWLGTDRLGRDQLSQIMAGAQVTVLVGLVTVAIGAVVGVPLGFLAASRGGWVSAALMRGTDLVLAFPALLLAILFAAAFGASTLTAAVALGLAAIPGFARVARSGALQVLGADFVAAARAAGRGPVGIARTHLFPNVASNLLVQASVTFALAVLAEAGLSYLGLGTAPPTPSWGRMLAEAQSFLGTHDYLLLVPGAAIATAVLGFNLLGDGLRDWLDPRLLGAIGSRKP